jgi:WD40 repeat protein
MTGVAPALKSPYPGLRPFEAEESDLFFGREPQIDELLRRLGRTRFVAVIGSSGSGKSSLVRAGLIPALVSGFLTSAGSHWHIALFRPGGDPVGALRDALYDTLYAARGQNDYPADLLEITLRRSSLGLVEATRQAYLPEHENLLIIVDQFEELFRFQRARGAGEAQDQAAALVKLLLEAVRQTEVPVHVLITMRSDFLGDCSQFRDLPETINDGLYLIPRMTRDQFRQAIVGPAAVCDAAISPRLAQQLLNDLGNDPDQLPVLQHALMRAWNRWRNKPGDSNVIDVRDYLDTGGMAEALSRHADEAWEELSASDRQVAARMFQCLTEKGPDNREIRRPTRFGDICRILEVEPAVLRSVIESFRHDDRAFLMPPRLMRLNEASVIDIAHESLIRKWGRLRGWVDEEAQSRVMYMRLAQAARLNSRNEAGLWRNPDLQRALDWKERTRPNAAWAERYDPDFALSMDFLDRSVAAHQAEQAREEAIRQTEERAAGIERARRRTLLLLVAMAVAAGVLSWLVMTYRRLLNETTASRLATQAALLQSQKDAAVDTSLLLALESIERVPLRLSDEIARSSLALLPRQVLRRECRAGVRTAAVSPNGKYAAWGCDGGSAVVASIPDGKEIALPAHTGGVTAVVFSPDSTYVATGGDDGIARVMEAATGKQVSSLKHGAYVTAAAFSADGRYLATGSRDGSARVMEVQTGKVVGQRDHGRAGSDPEADYRVAAVAFSPGGRHVAAGSYDQTVSLMNLSGKPVWQVKQFGNVYGVAFSRDGRYLATASGDGSARVLEVEQNGRQRAQLVHEQAVNAVAFSPDGRYVATASSDHTARLLDAASGKEVARLKHQNVVNAVLFFGDGRHIATASLDHTARVMEAPTGREIARFPHQDSVRAVSASADGQYLVTGSADHSVRVLTGIRGNETFRDSALATVTVAAVSPGGRYLATAGAAAGDKVPSVRIIDLSKGTEIARIRQQETVNDARFSADERYVAWGAGKTAWVAELGTGRVVASIEGNESVYGIALSPDGRFVGTAGADGTALVLDRASRKELVRVSHKAAVVGIAFSRDGRYVATGSADKATAVVEIATGKEVSRDTQQDQANAVAFSPDSRYLAVGGADGMLRVIETGSGREVSRHPHPYRINAIAFNHDGKQVATASEDAARVMDAATGREVSTIRQNAPVVAVSFVNGDGVLQTFAGNALQRHAIRPEELAKQACAQLSRNLTPEEWNQYVSESSYRQTCAGLP